MDHVIWDCFKKQNGEQMLLTSCGAELQELMRQMDIMVKNKKLEWKTEMAAIQDSLDLKEQELAHSRAFLQQKDEEISFLKQQIKNYESGQKSIAKDYKSRLSQLQCQMNNLKEAHENMQQHHEKCNQTSEEKEEEMLIEIQQLKSDLKEKQAETLQHDAYRRELEARNRTLQQQIQTLEKKKQTWKLAQARLEESSQKVKYLEGTGQSLLQKLERELTSDKKLLQKQENHITELQSKTRELNKARRTAAREKYRYQEEADKANCKLKVFAEEVETLQIALSARQSALQGSEHEIAELANKIERLEVAIHAKEKIIEAMQTRSPLKSKDDDLNQKIILLEATVESMVEAENQLRGKIKSLTAQLQASKEGERKLHESINRNDCDEVAVVNDDIRRLRINLEEMEASHSTQLCVIKAEITNLSTLLHGREANRTRIGKTCAEIEKQLEEESQERNNLEAHLQTAITNLVALRKSASDQSGRVAGRSPSMEGSLVEAECQLTSIKRNYEEAVQRLQEENHHLRSKISGLKQLSCNEGSARNHEANSVIEEENIRKESSIKKLCQTHDERKLHKIQKSDDRHSLTPSCSIIVRSAGSESDEFPVVKSESNMVQKTPTPTRDFLCSIGVDLANVSESTSSGDVIEDQLLRSLFGTNHEEIQNPSIKNFVTEEDQRMCQLESQIAQCVEDMKQAMDLTMKKYYTS